MSNTYYRLYVDSVKQLVSTMVIKSEATALAINQGLTDYKKSVVDTTDPTTWKYYLNLAGRYHPTDVPMTVLSLDTRELITFDVDTLKQHRATRRDYQWGSRYYKDLVTKYPEQEDLILGILNPIDLATAIATPDHQILWVDPALIEENETNLVYKLQTNLNNHKARWYMRDYALVDDLYETVYWGQLSLLLILWVLNVRLENCKTLYAHSFHIREYLASHGKLDVFIDTMTKKQMLFFYRNILYIQRNAGKKDTFEWLVQNVLTDRGLPLAQYEMRHNLSQQPTDLYPTIDLKRTPVNTAIGRETKDTRTVQEILEKQIPLARDNATVLDYAAANTVDIMEDSLRNKLSTKVLESSVIDRTDSQAFTLTDTLLNYWLYFSTNNLYPTTLTVSNPKTGEDLTVNAKDAFALYLYSYNQARQITLETIPPVWACRVRKLQTPTHDELMSVVDSTYVDPRFADATLDNQPVIERILSIEAFNDKCRELWKAQLLHRDLYAYREHYVTRGQVEALTGFMYCDIACDPGVGLVYEDWLKERGLDLGSFTLAQFDLLAQDLLKTATGADLNTTKSLKELQASMLRLMGKLSSYSIQFIPEINSDAIKVVDWAAIRLGDEHVTTHDRKRAHTSNIYVHDLATLSHAEVYVDLTAGSTDITVSAREKHRVRLETGLCFNLHGVFTTHAKVVMPTVYVDLKSLLDRTLDDLPVKDTEDYTPLTPPVQVANRIPLTDAVVDPDLDGFGDTKRPLVLDVDQPDLDGFDDKLPLTVAVKLADLDGFGDYKTPLTDAVDAPDLDGFGGADPLQTVIDPALDGFGPNKTSLTDALGDPDLDGFPE